MKSKILLLYPYYWPHYKAGGPVQSLYNLVDYFKHQADFYLLSLDCDIDGSHPSQAISLNRWTEGPNGEHIFFSRTISSFLVLRIIREIKPDSILINGIFNINTSLPGVIWGTLLGAKIIISPRGMLQQWGLQRNKRVKKIFLMILKFILNKTTHWHATNDQEKKEILAVFGKHQEVSVAANIPRKVSTINKLAFSPGRDKIKLIFLSLINSNKNLHIIIEAVNKLKHLFSLDIYGPIINGAYWASCQEKISGEAQITYRGPIPSWDVPEILKQYHFFVLPTQGENFGHAIFDALSCGMPVIVTRNTPWQNLDDKKAGFYVDSNVDSLYHVLQSMCDMTEELYNAYRENSFNYAKRYLGRKELFQGL